MAEPVQIALVEDDAAVLNSLQLYLARQDLETSCFEAAQDLLDAVDGGVQFNCIVSDVRMPGMSGLDLVRHLVARSVVAPIILITGHGDIDMAVSAIKSGAFNFIDRKAVRRGPPSRQHSKCVGNRTPKGARCFGNEGAPLASAIPVGAAAPSHGTGSRRIVEQKSDRGSTSARRPWRITAPG
jgi:CheY-like chemotaxis protein